MNSSIDTGDDLRDLIQVSPVESGEGGGEVGGEVKNPVMVLITKEQRAKLIKAGFNGQRPVVKLFVANLTWLVTGEEDGILYGYGDLGYGIVEWGSLCSVDELPGLKSHGIFYLERDLHFKDDPAVDYTSLETLAGI